MNQGEGLSTKIWLEQYENRPVGTRQSSQIKKFKFKKETLTLITTFLKKNHLSWDAYLPMMWGIFLNRLNPSTSILFGYSKLVNVHGGKLKIDTPIKPLTSTLSSSMTVQSYINKMQKQWKANSAAQQAEFNQYLRYVILQKTKQKTKRRVSTTLSIDTDSYPLILIYNKIKDELIFHYNEQIFPEEMVKTIIERLEITAREFSVKTAKQKVTAFNLLTATEKQQIFSLWEKGDYPFITNELTGNLHELLAMQALKNPQQIAVNHNETVLSYQDLDFASTLLAKNLLKNGVRIGETVAILMDRSINAIITLFAVLKCGAIGVPINTAYPEEKINYILADCKAKCLITAEEHLAKNKIVKNNFVFSEHWHQLKDHSMHLPKINLSQSAFVIYTAGTTGKPKGVVLSHHNLMHLTTWYRGCFNVNAEDSSAQFSAFGSGAFLCEIMPFLTSGARVYIMDDYIKFTPSLFFQWLKQHKITVCDIPTSYAQLVLVRKWPNNLALRLLKIGGERLNRYPAQTYSFDIWNTYGSAETGLEAIFIKLYTANTEYYHSSRKFSPPIGRPIAGSRIYVVDHYKQPVPVGVAGELWIAGPNIAQGYFNREELTQEKFINNSFIKNAKGKIYRTGDLVRWMPDGNLEYVDRMDHSVQIQNYQANLSDIENTINQYPDVNQAIVMVKENPQHKKSVIVYVAADLDKSRYLYQVECLLTVNNQLFETVTEDISKEGLALYGVYKPLNIGSKIQIHLQLPGMTRSQTFTGRVIWQQEQRMGVAFVANDEEQALIAKSIDYYLATHNIMDLVLNAANKRSLEKALRNQIPKYMLPSAFVTLPQLPTSLSGKVDKQALLKRQAETSNKNQRRRDYDLKAVKEDSSVD